MSSARERILGHLRSASIATLPPLPDVHAWYATRQRHEDAPHRIARLRSALEAAHAEVHDTTAAGWPERLLDIAAAKGLRTLLIGAGTPHGAALEARQPGHLPTALRLVRYSAAIETWRDTLFDGIDAGLTLARSAIAETGSLILWPSPAEPRLMSLVPPVHFVLLDGAPDGATIHADLYSAMSAEGWTEHLPTNALLVSGPSKTADIQQTLAYGAHGPKELIVLLLHAEGDKGGTAA